MSSPFWWVPFKTFRGNTVGERCMILGVRDLPFCLLTDIAHDLEGSFFGLWKCQCPCLDESMKLMWISISFHSTLYGAKEQGGGWGKKACVCPRLEVLSIAALPPSFTPHSPFLLSPSEPGCQGSEHLLLFTCRHPPSFTDVSSPPYQSSTDSWPVWSGLVEKTWTFGVRQT